MSDHDNYCYHDGSSLKEATTSFSILTKDPVFCSSCGYKVKEYGNYCSSCGSDLQTLDVQSSTSGAIITSVKEKNFIPSFQGGNLQNNLLSSIKDYLFNPGKILLVFKAISVGVAVSLLINFVFALIANLVLSTYINEIIQEALNDFSIFLPNSLSFVNPGMMLLVMQGIIVSFNANAANFVSMRLVIGAGVYVLVALLALSFIIGGRINGKRLKDIDGGHMILYSIGAGLMNVTFLLICFMFARYSETFQIAFADVEISISYSMFDIFIKGFSFAFLFHMFGIILSQKSKTKKLSDVLVEHFKRGPQIHYAIKTFVLGMIFLYVFSIVAYNVSIFILYSSFDLDYFFLGMLIMTQSTPYLYGLTHFSSIAIVSYREVMNISIFSVPKLMEGATWELYFIALIALLAFLIHAILFFRAGYQMKEKHSIISITDILFFGAFYAFLSGFWLWLGRGVIKISGYGFDSTMTGSYQVEANVLLYVIFATVLSSLIAFAGTKLVKKTSN